MCHRGGDCKVVEFVLLPVQSMLRTTNVVSSNPAHGYVYSIQQYMIKCVSDLRQVGDFLWVLGVRVRVRKIK